MAESFPQFNTAEFAGQSGSDRCKFCNQAVSGRYYRVNGAMACNACAEQARNQLPEESHGAFVRGLLFGIVGAVFGLIIYAAFGIITGLMIGYVSLAVGYIVGKAIKLGSKGIGGRRYQIAAVILTYGAVSMAAVPIYIAQAAKEPSAQVQQVQTPPSNQKELGLRGFVVGLAVLAAVGLASPFLELADPFHGLIGLVILFVGIRIAWQLTAGTAMQISGPFNVAAPSTGPTPAG